LINFEYNGYEKYDNVYTTQQRDARHINIYAQYSSHCIADFYNADFAAHNCSRTSR